MQPIHSCLNGAVPSRRLCGKLGRAQRPNGADCRAKEYARVGALVLVAASLRAYPREAYVPPPAALRLARGDACLASGRRGAPTRQPHAQRRRASTPAHAPRARLSGWWGGRRACRCRRCQVVRADGGRIRDSPWFIVKLSSRNDVGRSNVQTFMHPNVRAFEMFKHWNVGMFAFS